MNAQQFRKKPVVIEAMQFDGSIASAAAICQWANAGDAAAGHDDPTVSYITYDGDAVNAHDMVIWTLEGDMTAAPGDWIIRGVKGEHYPCKPDIFAATYEPAAIAALSAEGGAVAWDKGSPCVKPRPVGMVYPPKPAPRASGYLPDGSGVEWNAYDTGQMEAYARAAYADGYAAAAATGDMVLVPREPTRAMVNAAKRWQQNDAGSTARDMYAAMIAAAQQESAPYQEEEQVCDCGHPEAEWNRRQHSADCGLHNTAED